MGPKLLMCFWWDNASSLVASVVSLNGIVFVAATDGKAAWYLQAASVAQLLGQQQEQRRQVRSRKQRR